MSWNGHNAAILKQGVYKAVVHASPYPATEKYNEDTSSTYLHDLCHHASSGVQHNWPTGKKATFSFGRHPRILSAF
jgi:hypothetical protein